MEGLLPIGSVVLLKDSTKKVMIIGFCQKELNEQGTIWDYSGCLFPEGYISGDKCFLFQNEQISKVFFLGYQDDEQEAFIQKVEAFLAEKKQSSETI